MSALTNNILGWFSKAWEHIKRFANWIKVQALIFFDHIFNFFKSRISNYNRKRFKAVAINVQSLIDKNDFNEINIGLYDDNIIVKGFYDIENGELADDIEITKFDSMDQDTINNFNGKSLLILQ